MGSPARSPRPETIESPARPASIKIAVWLMLAGAAGSGLATFIWETITLNEVHGAATKAFNGLTGSDIGDLWPALPAFSIVIWLWMAVANHEGQRQARLWSSILFAGYTTDAIFVTAITTIRAVLANCGLSGGGGFDSLYMTGVQVGRFGLQGAFSDFCNRWSWGVRSLVKQGN